LTFSTADDRLSGCLLLYGRISIREDKYNHTVVTDGVFKDSLASSLSPWLWPCTERSSKYSKGMHH